MSEYQRPEPCGTQPITAPRLNLRKFKDYDAPAMFEWLNDGKVLRYFVAPPPKSIEEARQMIQSWRGQYAEDTFMRWCIAEATDNSAVGEIAASVDIETSCAEVEYVIAPEARRKGYASEALSAIIDYLHKIGIHRVTAEIRDTNGPSAKTAEAAGMVLEGILTDALIDRDGNFYDVGLFAHVSETD